MAVFEYKLHGEVVPVRCASCGSRHMFQHEETLLTCNRCGHTFETPAPATTVIERVVNVKAD